MSKKKSIVCFGEVLWDIFPDYRAAGGAPMNVIFHADNFGMDAQLISAVGNDELGKEMIAFLHKKNIETTFVHTNYTFPTGSVKLRLDEEGAAEYEIFRPVAWDFLYTDSAIENIVSETDLFLFGSLICRSPYNLKVLLHLIEKATTSVFDVNLRPPFYDRTIIEQLLQKAHIVKMNEEEFEIISQWYRQKGSLENRMNFLMNKFDIKTLLITLGKDGACCMQDEKLYTQKGFPVQVHDTVGSGDSFFAAFLFKISETFSIPKSLEFACAVGALVATEKGGTPVISEESILSIIQEID